jgi:cell division septation protein DedD
MENTMHRSLIAVALLLLAPLATAQVYKWTDASGTVHYSEAPPAQGTQFKQVKTTGTAAPLVAPASSSSEAGREPTAEPAKPTADTPENRARMCDSVKANLTALQGGGPVVMQTNGKTTALDGDQRKQQLTATQAQYEQYCQGR